MFEERKIGERLHRVDSFGLELFAKERVIKTALQMMHAGLEKTFAVQSAPETDRAELGLRGQRDPREIHFHFVGVQIDVVKNDDAFDGLLDDLSAPAGFFSRIITFAPMEAEQFPRFDQVDESFAR